MFHLHSSASHAFFLTRLSKQGYSFSGPDEAVLWDRVRVVKYLALPNQEGQGETCPICLDNFTCARITKCGHCYCLPCLLRHLHTSTATNPNVAVKCPCCGLPVHLDDIRPVQIESVQPTKAQTSLRLVKLHRVKECYAPYLPRQDQSKHCSSHMAPIMTDPDAAYSRFNYVDPPTFHALLSTNEKDLTDYSREVQSDGIELFFAQMALERVRNELAQALRELEDEEARAEQYALPTSGMYQPIPESLFCKPLDEQKTDFQMDSQASESSQRFRGESIGSESDSSTRLGRPHRVGSIDSADSTTRSKRERRLPNLQASAYLEDGSYQFYQSEDGQLCFLSKFNMNCLTTEFSTSKPDDPTPPGATSLQLRKLRSLPDYVEGRVVEIESVHLTQELRKRMPFLAHLPVHTDVLFVELDLSRILSDETKAKMKGEFEKRRRRRKSKKEAEKRADKASKLKEEERINELKARMQRIDPNDAFFFAPDPTPPLSEDFGPSISTNDTAAPNNPPTLSFSSVIATPSSMAMTEEAFPSLGVPAPTNDTEAQPTWGRGWHASNAPAKNVGEVVPSSTGDGRRGKKPKGKKVVLFSTGGHRGQGY